MANSIRFDYAIYFLPTHGKTDPFAILHELLSERYPKLKLVDEIPATPTQMLVQARLERDVPHQYSPPSLESLEYFGKGLDQKQAQALQKSQEAFILTFAHPKEYVWTALRAADELTEELVTRMGGLVWDEETRNVFTPDSWHSRNSKAWVSEIPDVSSEIVIHVYQKEEYVRAISLGMSKVGLPDAVVEDFPWSSESQVGDVIDLFCQSLVEGASLKNSGSFKLDIRAIKNKRMKEMQLKRVKPPGTGVACLSLKPGVWEEGDPKNRLLRLAFDEYPGPDVHAQRESMINALFGSDDSIHKIEHNEELLVASRKAKSKLPELQRAFNAGLRPGEYIDLKAPFPTPEGNREWMWVEVTTWKNGAIRGTLANDPFEIPTMHAGQVVNIREADVFDYIRHYPDRHDEGNTTGEIIMRLESSAGPRSRAHNVEQPVVPKCE